ncbi:MAG TPA: PilZ domain-containing protein [Candidatus Omnitrophota bacterium]|nr:PilZ domain-containing protein [Candidatus Omnitrophota bacterium]
MQQWVQLEKRKTPRFEISLPVLTYPNASEIPVPSMLHDLGAGGLGVTLDCDIPIGTLLDIILMMPEQEDQVRLRGTIIWVHRPNSLGHVRAGIRFEKDHFNPIPYILKILQSKAKKRISYSRPYLS